MGIDAEARVGATWLRAERGLLRFLEGPAAAAAAVATALVMASEAAASAGSESDSEDAPCKGGVRGGPPPLTAGTPRAEWVAATGADPPVAADAPVGSATAVLDDVPAFCLSKIARGVRRVHRNAGRGWEGETGDELVKTGVN